MTGFVIHGDARHGGRIFPGTECLLHDVMRHSRKRGTPAQAAIIRLIPAAFSAAFPRVHNT